jgi:outer membrane cobalamin receptor
MRKIIVALVVLICTKVGWTGDIELEKIVVTPSRIAQTYSASARRVDIISERSLKYSNPRDISEVLEKLSSLNITNYGFLGAKKVINIRGSTEKQVLVLVDGRPINNPRSGDIDLSTIPLNNVQRIEVMAGPASSLYGSTAMGGVVNIITKTPPAQGQTLELSSSFGTFRTYQENLSYGVKHKELGLTLNSGYQSSEGHRDNSKFNARDASGKLIYELSPENKLTFQGGFYKDKLGTPGEITSPDLDDKQINRKNFFDLVWDIKPWQDKDIEVSTRAYQNYDRLEFIETPMPLDKTTHTTKARGINLKFNQEISKLYRMIYGFDWTHNLNDSSQTAKHRYIVRAGYLENQLSLWEKLKLNFGARIDDYSNFGSETLPSLGILYQLKEDLNINFLIARCFRAPTFNDLYWPRTSYAEGNPALRPEKGISGEFGIEKSFGKFLKTGLTYFRSDYDNLIKWQRDSDNIWRPKNINSAIIDGVEQEFKIAVSDFLNIDLDYTFLRAKDAKTHKYLTYQPKHKATLEVNYKTPAGFRLGLEGEFVDTRFHNTANTIYVKRYYLLGLGFSQKIGNNLNIFCRIDDFLNKRYQVIRNYPMPGFSLTGGFRLEF